MPSTICSVLRLRKVSSTPGAAGDEELITVTGTNWLELFRSANALMELTICALSSQCVLIEGESSLHSESAIVDHGSDEFRL